MRLMKGRRGEDGNGAAARWMVGQTNTHALRARGRSQFMRKLVIKLTQYMCIKLKS